MNIFKIAAYSFVTLGLWPGLACLETVWAAEDAAGEPRVLTLEQSGELYLPSKDPMADITKTIASARGNGKLVLVVMGANWCHDSRALAARLYQPPLHSMINEHYEIVFVDVGYLDKGKDVISSLGVPVYYATPTVLIVDPVSRQLVNRDNRHLWADAYNISMDESVDYFRLMTRTDLVPLRSASDPGENLQKIMSDIDAFEKRQAKRIYAAYAVLGPMLRAYENDDAPALFDQTWNEVRDFRYKVAADIDTLRSDALAQAIAGETDISLDYPEYATFSWETAGQ